MVCCKTTYASLLLALLLLALVQTSLSQNYHFSNGWYPGKKRSSSSSSVSSDSGSSSRASTGGYAAFEDSCTLRPEAVMLISRIMQDEAARMQRSCNSEAPSGLTDILENSASKLESEGKW